MAPEWTRERIKEHLLSETHHGKPGLSAAKKNRLARDLAPQANEWIPWLLASPIGGARQVGALLLAPLWAEDESWTPAVLRLAEDADWEVREWVVEPFRCRYAQHPDASHFLYREWASGGTPGVKRAMAVAIKHLAHERQVAADRLLDLADLLADEEDEYVRKNLGPFAVGDGLLLVYPEDTMRQLEAWAGGQPWAVRWNAAMSLTAKKARAVADRAAPILDPLIQDPDRRVRQAAARAAKALALPR